MTVSSTQTKQMVRNLGVQDDVVTPLFNNVKIAVLV